MSDIIDRFIKQHKEYFKRNHLVIKNNLWNKEPELSKKAKLFKQENELTTSIVGRLSAFIKLSDGDRKLAKTQKFIDYTVDIINTHINKCDTYLDYKMDELIESSDDTEEEIDIKNQEISFQDDIFNSKISIQDKLDNLNIKFSAEDLKFRFYSDQMATLPMAQVLTIVNSDIKEATDTLKLKTEIGDKTFYKDLIKKGKVPEWNEKKHYWEQDKKTLDFWQNEWLKITKGFEVDGYSIHPWLYWHLNFFKTPIPQDDGTEPILIPDFRDTEFIFVEDIKRAEKEGNKGVMIYGSRRLGKSTLMSSYCHWKALTKPNSSATVTSGSEGDLIDLTHKIKTSMKYVPKAFYLYIQSQEWTGGSVELGLKSSASNLIEYSRFIIKNLAGGTTKSTQKTAGGAPSVFLIEEIGKFDWKKSYLAAKPSFETKSKWKCIPLAVGCVCAGSKVWDNEGNLINIEDLNPEKGILGYDVESKSLSKEKITYWQPPHEKECYRITTNTGRILECSDDHPILFRSRHEKEGHRSCRTRKIYFKETKDLKVGEQIATIEEVNIFGKNRMWEPRLVGLLIGDGSYGFNSTPVLSNCDSEINNYAYSNFECVEEKSYVTKLGKHYKETRIKGITKELRELGIYGQTKDKKTLPTDIHSYTKEDICELLGGIFDADSYVGIKSIELSSAYKNLMLEVQLLLQKIGIHANIKYKNPSTSSSSIKGINGHYCLSVADKKSIETFHKSIYFLPEYKQVALEKLIFKLSTCKSKIPKEVSGLRFERVVSLEPIGLKPVYNLTAGNTHTYIANGIVTHNTGGEASLSGDAMSALANPSSLNFLEMDWDLFEKNVPKEAISWVRRTFATFIPAQLSYKVGMNTITTSFSDYLGIKSEFLSKIKIEKADWIGNLQRIKEDRKKLEGDNLLLQQEKVQYPINCEEVFLSADISPFSNVIEEARSHKEYLEQSGKWDRRRNLVKDSNGKIHASISTKPLVEFPFNDLNQDAPYLIIEDIPDFKPPKYMFVASADFYKQEKTSSTNSVCTVGIYKYALFGDPNGKKLVASYAGRPKTYKELNDKVLLLLEAYNAIMLPENEDLGVFQTYLETLRLEEQYLEKHIDFNTALKYSDNDARKWGYTPKQSKRKLISMYANYLDEPVTVENEEGEKVTLKRVQTIGDIWLLTEIINYSESGNYDRVSGHIGAVGLLHVLEKNYIYPKGMLRKNRNENEEENKKPKERTRSFYSEPTKRSGFFRPTRR